jgi:hypothetical protein
MTYSNEEIPSRRSVGLIYLVDVVHLVYPVSLVQPNKQDKPNNSLLTLAVLFSILLEGEVSGETGARDITR